MYDHELYTKIHEELKSLDPSQVDQAFFARLMSNASQIESLYFEIYGTHPEKQKGFKLLLQTIIAANVARSSELKLLDKNKLDENHWFLSNKLAGMSLYVDRFC